MFFEESNRAREWLWIDHIEWANRWCNRCISPRMKPWARNSTSRSHSAWKWTWCARVTSGLCLSCHYWYLLLSCPAEAQLSTLETCCSSLTTPATCASSSWTPWSSKLGFRWLHSLWQDFGCQDLSMGSSIAHSSLPAHCQASYEFYPNSLAHIRWYCSFEPYSRINHTSWRIRRKLIIGWSMDPWCCQRYNICSHSCNGLLCQVVLHPCPRAWLP